MISRIVNPNKFCAAHQPTIAVEMYSKVYTVDDGKRVCVNLWDTAGQERYKAITRQFYNGSHGVLLVYVELILNYVHYHSDNENNDTSNDNDANDAENANDTTITTTTISTYSNNDHCLILIVVQI